MMGKMRSAMAVAVLSVGIAAAQTNSASGVDWRYGRPGVFVVTNAEPSVTNVLAQRTITINGVSGSPVSNLTFAVTGDGGPAQGGVSAEAATNIAVWASTQSTQGLVSAEAAAANATNAALWAATQATQAMTRVIAVENAGWWTFYLVTP